MDLGWLFIFFLIISFLQNLYGDLDYGIFLLIPIVATIQYFTPEDKNNTR
jgi:hypothetical protein